MPPIPEATRLGYFRDVAVLAIPEASAATAVRNEANLTSSAAATLAPPASEYLLRWSDGRVETRHFSEAGGDFAIGGPWTVAFQPGRGAPNSITMPSLRSLAQHENFGVRHFAGVATYRTTFVPLVESGLVGPVRIVFRPVLSLER
jgi:hypothetical protein